ncbi:MAG: VWA domain-containing protein [Acidobacteria bacterium]|nr:VWA domain-containing protein [Acidobacteriota bacterium]
MDKRRSIEKVGIITFFVVLLGFTNIEIKAQDPPQKADQTKKTVPEQKSGKKGGTAEEPVIDVTEDILKIDTGFVRLDVTVIDQNNIPINDLKKENFTVLENKVPQLIDSVSTEEAAISFGLVLDTSSSMRSKIFTVKEAARGLLGQMKPGDEGFLAEFNYNTQLVHNFTADKSKLQKSMDTLRTGGGTALLDAIINSSEYTSQKGRLRKKALIIISDGLERNSSLREKEVLDAIYEHEVQIYLVGFIDDGTSGNLPIDEENKKARELLTRLADSSGGRAFFPKDVDEMPAIADRIAKDLRTQYVINYYPSNEKRDGTYRAVKVLVKSDDNRKLIARTRMGYFAREDQEAQKDGLKHTEIRQ